MLYSDLITLLRQDVNDFPVRRFDSADGDGATSVYNLSNTKVLENSYVVQVGGVTQTEGTAYTMYPDQGQIIFNSGYIPGVGNDNITFQYESVNMRDSDWIDLINQVLLAKRKKLWIEFVNETDPSIVTVLSQVDYPLSALASDIISLTNIEYQSSSTAPWQDTKGFTNCIFYRDLQTLHMRPPFYVGGYQLRIKGIRAYVLGTTAGSTLELQERYWPVVRKYCESYFWERLATRASWQTGALSKEVNFENMTTLKKLAADNRAQADDMLKQVKPIIPAVGIPNALYGVNI